MEKSIKITLIIVTTVLFLGIFGILFFSQSGSAVTISSNGEAVVKAMPDLLTIYFSINTNAESAQEARNRNAEIFESLVERLNEQGIEKKQIVTESFSLNPTYKWTGREHKEEGYKAYHLIKVQVSSEYENSGKLIDAGIDAGANVNYINFELSQEKQNEYKAEALEKATKDAKAKAQGIASGLESSLGRVVSVSTDSFDYSPWRLYNSVEGASDSFEAKEAITGIQPGEREITGRVSVVFALK
jgi:uncharacterized protein